MEGKQPETQNAPVSKTMRWAGRIISALPVLMLLMSGTMKFLKPPDLAEQFGHLGWDENLALVLGILEITCAVIFVIPQTAVLGAILLTGYLGGAIATHLRVGDPFMPSMLIPIVLGILIWGGLYLRDVRLRAILPLRA